VITLAAYGLTDVPVLTRTSDTTARGVAHPRNPAIGLTKEGVFAFRYQRSIDQRWFALPDRVKPLGQLEKQYFDQVLAWWETG
jgi:hypothetical protein